MSDSSDSIDALQEVTNEKILFQIQNLYKADWPGRSYIYYYLDTAISWKKYYNYPINFYIPYGNWENGTIFTITNSSTYTIVCATLEKSQEELRLALAKTRIINWSRRPFFGSLHKDQTPIVLDVAIPKNLMPSFMAMTAVWWISHEEARKFTTNLSPDTYLSPLTDKDAVKIYNLWPYRTQRKLDFVQDLIMKNGGIGLYRKSDDLLLSWVLHNEFGTLGLLQTDDDHRGKGYAEQVTQSLCLQFAKKKIDSIAFVTIGNVASEKLFEKLGFKPVNFTNWFTMKPIPTIGDVHA